MQENIKHSIFNILDNKRRSKSFSNDRLNQYLLIEVDLSNGRCQKYSFEWNMTSKIELRIPFPFSASNKNIRFWSEQSECTVLRHWSADLGARTPIVSRNFNSKVGAKCVLR